MTDLWYPKAVRWLGNPAVTGYPPSIGGTTAPKRGAVEHSAEGKSWDVIHDLLLTKSWHFTVGYDRVEQHHPCNVNCWHGADTDDDGGVRANIDLEGIEHLGIAGEPLTPWQIGATVDLNRWLGAQYDRHTFRRFDGFDPDEPGVWLMCEHNEVSNTYTACPSGRIPWPEVMGRLNAPLEELEDQMVTGHFAKAIPWDKSYVATVGKEGARKTLVANAAEYESLVAAGFPVRVMPLGQLRNIISSPGTPEP